MVNKKAILSAKGLFTFFGMLRFGLILALGAAQEKAIKKAPIKYTDPGSAIFSVGEEFTLGYQPVIEAYRAEVLFRFPPPLPSIFLMDAQKGRLD